MKKIVLALMLFLSPVTSRADLFGGDVVVLVQLLANSLQQLTQLKAILGSGKDAFGLMQEVNRGIREGLNIIQIVNPKFNPGLYGNLDTADRVLATIQDLYGRIPKSGESRLQEAQDRSVAESIAMNGTLFKFADTVDAEGKRIMEHSKNVNPQGAAKLTAQSMAVLIGVTTQVLRTNSMMLKMMGENMALQNKREKAQASQFRMGYDGLATALSKVPPDPTLKPLR